VLCRSLPDRSGRSNDRTANGAPPVSDHGSPRETREPGPPSAGAPSRTPHPGASIRRPVGAGQEEGDLLARLADLQDRIQGAERRIARVRDQVQDLRVRRLDDGAAREALAAFDPVWETLAPQEQAWVVELLVPKVDYDGAKGSVAIAFHPTGIRALADELAGQNVKEAA
jgi:hypothetical protein